MLIHSLQKTELHKQNNKLELPKWFSQQLESEHETIFFTWSLHHKRVKKLQNLLTKIIPIESKSFKAFHFFVGQFLLLWKIKLWFLLFWNSKWFNYIQNGMLRQEPSFPENLPSLFICRCFFSFCPFNRGRACLQARGLALRTAMSAGTRLNCKQRDKIPTKKREVRLKGY